MKLSKIRNRQYLIGFTSIVALGVLAYQVWQIWPSLVISSIQWQRDVNAGLADLLYDAKSSPWTAGGYLVGFSFLYGMLHSLGPGHGKVIVTTYLATHPTKAKASLVLTVVSALCQALVAITLVSVLLWGFNVSMKLVNEQAATFVSLSFTLVAMMGALICWKSLKNIWLSYRSNGIKVKAISPLVSQKAALEQGISFTVIRSAGRQKPQLSSQPIALRPKQHSDHHHSDTCGCGHQHVADANAINRASTLKEYAALILTIGIRPCTGAIMVLLFANVVGMYWMGVVSAIAMAFGTALTTSIIAIMTLTGKRIVKRYLNVGSNRSRESLSMAGYYLQLLGGILLISFGLLLMTGPEYGMSPIFSV